MVLKSNSIINMVFMRITKLALIPFIISCVQKYALIAKTVAAQ